MGPIEPNVSEGLVHCKLILWYLKGNSIYLTLSQWCPRIHVVLKSGNVCNQMFGHFLFSETCMPLTWGEGGGRDKIDRLLGSTGWIEEETDGPILCSQRPGF